MNTFLDQYAESPSEGSYTAETVAARERLTKTRPASVPRASDIEDEDGELTVDIYDGGDAIVIQSTVAGVKPEDLDISIMDDTITVKGKRAHTEEVRESNYYYKELFWGTFTRSIILPQEVDEEGIQATLKNGLLTIRLPKKRQGRVQKINIAHA